MNSSNAYILTLFVCNGILANSCLCHAEFTILGPLPYRSAADSPFNVNGLGTTFFLEDFEDNVLTPGIENGPGYPTATRPLSGNTVDADDGTLDGLGIEGHSVSAYQIDGCIGACRVNTAFDFGVTSTGRYPVAVGIVITASNGAQGSILVDAYFDGQHERHVLNLEGIVSNPSDANDDLFFGFINPLGIFTLQVEQLRRPFNGTPFFAPFFDHLQYSLLVPEPDSFLLVFLSLSNSVCHRRSFVRNSHKEH